MGLVTAILNSIGVAEGYSKKKRQGKVSKKELNDF